MTFHIITRKPNENRLHKSKITALKCSKSDGYRTTVVSVSEDIADKIGMTQGCRFNLFKGTGKHSGCFAINICELGVFRAYNLPEARSIRFATSRLPMRPIKTPATPCDFHFDGDLLVVTIPNKLRMIETETGDMS